MGFTRAELEAARDLTVPDLLGLDTRLLFVGINPGLWTAAAQAHFARRGNRFYPALLRGGVVDRLIDASNGYVDDDRQHLLDRGLGITNLVARATARADELTADELGRGAARLTELSSGSTPASSPCSASPRTERHSASPRPWPDDSPRHSSAASSGWFPTRAASTRTPRSTSSPPRIARLPSPPV